MRHETRASVLPVLCLVVSCALLGSPTVAREPLGDLDLRLRVIDVPAAPAARGASTVARVQLTLEAFVPAAEVRLAFRRSSRAFDPGRLEWQRPTGARIEPAGDGTLRVAPREVVTTTFEVPLEGPGLYEVVVGATARGPAGMVATESMVWVPLGVPPPGPTIEGDLAVFPAGSPDEVRP